MNHFRVYGLTCVLMVAATGLVATTIVMPTDEQLVEKTPLIVEGTILSTTTIDHGGSIWTESIVEVSRVLKGKAAKTLVVRELGGEIENRITKVFGSPEYRAGEHVLLFLTPTPRGDYQTVDLFVGKFTEETMMNGRKLWARDLESDEVVLLDARLEAIESRNVQRDAGAFERFVVERVAGFKAVANYGVENPILERSLSTKSGTGSAALDFTLISEPTIYRWFMFDSGSSAPWYTYGTQAGYTSGGITEMQTAMAAWTGYTAARIRYAYSGASTVAPGGLSRRNNVNEILFDDPLGEIAGSWNRSTAGVVGTGGFNGISGMQSWTSPFAADAQHPQMTYPSAYSIVEGNLTIQDGVSASAGISSDRLSEIISHEFGHTLGFGHSHDSTALMYATVTGIGPSLRADDQTAARWLYPSGTATPPPPVTLPGAPSNLTATVSGSSVALQWTDNASNETGQSIYVAAGSGAFNKVADVANNVTAATLSGFSTGTYRIYVAAFNATGTSVPSNTTSVTVSAAVAAAFSVSPGSGVAGQTLFTFTDQSTGAVSTRSWQFGDGSSSAAQNPTRTYASPGQYTVTLTVGGGGTQSTTSRLVTVVAPTAPLVAAFSFAPANPIIAQAVSFTDQSTGGATAWQWNFGDGTVSSQQNPAKSYVAPGTYTATLTAYRDSQAAATSRTITVVSPVPATPAVTASFDFAPSGGRVGEGLAFADRSGGSPDRWSWSFGDGQASNARNPVHVFSAPGSYTVTLTAANAGSSSTASRSVSISSAIVPFRSLVSASAQTTGAGGTFWRTELTLFNAGSEGVSISAIFIPAAGGSPQSRSLFLAPLRSISYANALVDLFSIGSGAGAIAIEASSATASPLIKVSSRTFTTGGTGTYGQGVQDVTDKDLGQTLYLTGMSSNASYRTNLGFVNKSPFPVSVSMTLHNASGTTIGVANAVIPANQYQQNSLATYFAAVAQQPYDALSLRATTSVPDAVNVFASVIDNRSQDPIYIQGAPLPGGAMLLPAVGRAPGANGTFWRSDVTLFNPSFAPATVTLRYAAAGTRTLTLTAGETRVLSDIISWFGLGGSSSGMLEVSSFGSMPVVTSRSYTTDVNGGTYGQSVDPVAAFGRDMYVTGLRSDVSFRSNVGFVNGGGELVAVSVRLLASSGQVVAATQLMLGASSQAQYSLASLFPGVNVAGVGTVTLHARTDGAPTLFAYGSIIDNASGDPVFFAGE